MVNKKILSMLLILVLSIGVLAGCTAQVEESAQEQYMTIVGSTSVTSVATELADAYMAEHEGVKIDVQGIGSSAGVKAANEKTANIGMASRNLKDAEKEWGLTEVVIAYDGIAVAVHPSNIISELTMDQVNAIFKGEISNWSEIGGKDAPIIIVSREDGSGTRGAFEEIVGLEEKDADGNKFSAVVVDALIAEGNGAVKANVASKEDSIGYLSLSYLDESVKTLVVDGAGATVEAIKSSDYGISRPFLMLLNDESGNLAQGYIDFVLSADGQAIVAKKLITVK